MPLHKKECQPFSWSAECAEAFTALKVHFTQAPVLAYPWFDHTVGTFQLQTDASAGGLGAVSPAVVTAQDH